MRKLILLMVLAIGNFSIAQEKLTRLSGDLQLNSLSELDKSKYTTNVSKYHPTMEQNFSEAESFLKEELSSTSFSDLVVVPSKTVFADTMSLFAQSFSSNFNYNHTILFGLTDSQENMIKAVVYLNVDIVEIRDIRSDKVVATYLVSKLRNDECGEMPLVLKDKNGNQIASYGTVEACK